MPFLKEAGPGASKPSSLDTNSNGQAMSWEWMKLDSLDRSFSVNCQLENVLMDVHSSATKTNSNRCFRKPKPGKPSPGTVTYGGGQSMRDLIISREWYEKRLKRNDNVEKPEPPYHLHRLQSSTINVPVFSGLVSVSSATNELSTLREQRCHLTPGNEELLTTTTNKRPKSFGKGCTEWPCTVKPSRKSASLCGVIRCIRDRQTDGRTPSTSVRKICISRTFHSMVFDTCLLNCTVFHVCATLCVITPLHIT